MALDVYQARNGALYLRNGNCATRLTHQQISELQLCIFDVEDFALDSYGEAYRVERSTEQIGEESLMIDIATYEPTSFVEANAFLAALEGEEEAAKGILRGMSLTALYLLGKGIDNLVLWRVHIINEKKLGGKRDADV